MDCLLFLGMQAPVLFSLGAVGSGCVGHVADGAAYLAAAGLFCVGDLGLSLSLLGALFGTLHGAAFGKELAGHVVEQTVEERGAARRARGRPAA